MTAAIANMREEASRKYADMPMSGRSAAGVSLE
jgi:hypothetical protein